MQTENKYITQLKQHLAELNPYRVLLFGSYATGNNTLDSDIDILVVTKDNFIPETFSEHTQIYMRYSKAIRLVKQQVAVDLIVHTLPMYRKFIEQNSSFANEILTQGVIIYEGNNEAMA